MIKLQLNIFCLKAVAITGCFFMISCSNNYQEVQDLAKKKVPIDTATQVESFLSQNGFVKAKLTAPVMTTLTVSDTPKTEFPQSLHVDFFDDSTKIQSRLFSKYGLYYNNKHLVLLRDSVIVFNTAGDTLRTEKLWWDQDKQLIYTDVAVHIREPDESIDGTGMTADQNFTHWTINNAKGPISVADSTLPSE